MKVCGHCKIEKELDAFNKETSKPDGRARTCRECRSKQRLEIKKKFPTRHSDYANKYRKENPEKYANWRTIRTHGISKEEVLSLVANQNGCKICKTTEPGNKGWVVDHDHNCCGKIKSCDKCRRGILCSVCNTMLGFAKDNKETLQNAIEYLEAYERNKIWLPLVN